MATEQSIRAFLLGMSDPETEKRIEEGILEGSTATDDLWAIEEELIDDQVFGRLSAEEEKAFRASFLTSQERKDKLSFSRAVHRYALEHRSADRARRRIFFGMNFRFALASGLALFGLVTATAAWFGVRDVRLGRQLSELRGENDERQRLLASLMDEQRQRASHPGNPATPVVQSAVASIPASIPAIQLRPGVRRGLEPVPVLHVAGEDNVIRIRLELAFNPEGGLRTELLRAGGERIWTQEVTSAAPIVSHGSASIYLPAQLLVPGDYRIRLKDLSAGPSDEGDVYAFRVSRP